MRKTIILVFTFVVCLSVFPFFVFAQDSFNQYTNVDRQNICLNYKNNEPALDKIFSHDNAIGYWNMVNNIEKNAVLKWNINKASKFIGEYPDKQKYAEILVNLIVMQSGDIAEQIQNQSQYDSLKGVTDYAQDIVGIVSDFIGGAGLLEDISPIIDAATGGADVIIDNIGQAKYYQASIKDYYQSKMFLEAVSTYASNKELKATASSLLDANEKLLEKRLEYLVDSSETLAEYQVEFFVENLSFDLLKTEKLYKNDKTVKWYVDCGEKLSKSLLKMYSKAKFAFQMTILAGDIGFGTSDTFNRYQEMKIVSDIAGAIVKANNNIQTPSNYNSKNTLKIIQTKCDYYKMLIVTHARGEYLVYQLLVNDAGLLSQFRVLFDTFKKPEETTESWYKSQTNIMLKYFDILSNMFVIKKEDSMEYDSETVPQGAVQFNGHYYYLYCNDEATDYTSAENYCKERGGYLATITSEKENKFLFNYIRKKGYASAYFGLNNLEDGRKYKWSNGELLIYTKWAENEPDSIFADYGYYARFDEDATDGTWKVDTFSGDETNFSNVFLCEWGDYSANASDTLKATSTERDIVLTLDVSASMDGIPLEETKKASTKFVDSVIDKNSNIGVVSYSDEAATLSGICSNDNFLKSNITELSSESGTNIEAGLSRAYTMLQSGKAKKKIIVLMSDGQPNEGKEGEDLIKYAQKIKEQGVLIYTLGFFQNAGEYQAEGQYLMEKIASEGCHYEVADSEDLVFFFEDVAGQISGQKYIYVRIACPVDVSVTYDGQTLSSAENNQNLRADFGTLSFEENDKAENGEYSEETDDRVKILRLKEGVDYDIKVKGTGEGEMDYTIGFMNDDGDYDDFRTFEDIDISKDTVIDTVANISEKTLLNIDEDGDGKYDLKLQAGINGYGEKVKLDKRIYIIIAIAFFCALFITFMVAKIKKRVG